jgi:predicted RNA-binding protein with RPS1 domain
MSSKSISLICGGVSCICLFWGVVLVYECFGHGLMPERFGFLALWLSAKQVELFEPTRLQFHSIDQVVDMKVGEQVTFSPSMIDIVLDEFPTVKFLPYDSNLLEEVRGNKLERVEGPVISIDKGAVYIDLPPFGTGIIYGREFMNARDIIKKINVGDTIAGKVVGIGGKDGYIEISLKEARQALIWSEAEEAIREKRIYELLSPMPTRAVSSSTGKASPDSSPLHSSSPSTILASLTATRTRSLTS